MEKSTLKELDDTIRDCIIKMQDSMLFDSHAILNYIYFHNRQLYDKMVQEDRPQSPNDWVLFRSRIYSRVNNLSDDRVVEMIGNDTSWSVLYDGNFGPCSTWKKVSKA